MYNLFWTRIAVFLKGSLFFRWLFALFSCVSNAFKESVIYSFFTKKNMGALADNSTIARNCERLVFKSALTDFISQSFLVWVFSKMPYDIFGLPLCMLSAYLLPIGVIWLVSGFGNAICMLVSFFVVVLGFLLLRAKIQIKSLMEKSWMLKLYCSYFEVNISENNIPKGRKRFALLFLLAGAAVGMASFWLGFKLSFLIFVVVLVLPLLIASPHFLLLLTFAAGVMFSSLPAFIFCILTFIVVTARIFSKMETAPKVRVVGIMVVVYLIFVAIYTFIGEAGSDSLLAGFTQVVLLTSFFSVVTIINTFEKLKKLICALSMFTLIPSGLGIYQFMTGQGGTGWTNEDFIGGLARISSFFANPNVYGEFLIFAVALCLTAILISSTAKGKFAFVSILVLQLINLALTYSRGCYLAVLLIALVVIWFCDKRLLSLGLVILPCLPYVLPKNMMTRIMSIGTYLQDGSVAYRFAIWKGAADMFSERWFAGTGVGTAAFMSVYNNYMFGNTPAQHSHNTFLQIAIELGIVGLCVFVLILIFSFRDVLNVNTKVNIKGKFLIIPLMACFIGIILQSFFDHVFYNNVVFFVFWLVLGVLVSALNIVSVDDRFNSADNPPECERKG